MRFGRNLDLGASGAQKRKLKTKPLLILIGILAGLNVLWFIGWLIPDKPKPTGEVVAKVAGEPIMREEWMEAMDKEVGREVLLDLVNEKVMETAAERYGIDVSDQEIELELALISSVDGKTYTGLDIEKLRQKIRANLILEKVLSKDVVVKEEEIKSFYDNNETLYNVMTAYRTSIIVVPTKKEADQTLDELSKGSSFDVLAKERSIDLASASLGGDIGYINESTDAIDKAILQTAAALKRDKNSDVIALSDGTYAVIRVNEVIDGQSFTFKEVKDHIKRELALAQLQQSVSPEAFWKEFDAEWFYGK